MARLPLHVWRDSMWDALLGARQLLLQRTSALSPAPTHWHLGCRPAPAHRNFFDCVAPCSTRTINYIFDADPTKPQVGAPTAARLPIRTSAH